MLTLFSFEGQDIRFVGTADKPEWIAADVCKVLELADTSKALSDFDDDEKGTNNIRTLGGTQSMLTVTESGLYKLIFKSRKEVAKRFQKWVTSEVLPSIRKTGSYTLNDTNLKRETLELAYLTNITSYSFYNI